MGVNIFGNNQGGDGGCVVDEEASPLSSPNETESESPLPGESENGNGNGNGNDGVPDGAAPDDPYPSVSFGEGQPQPGKERGGGGYTVARPAPDGFGIGELGGRRRHNLALVRIAIACLFVCRRSTEWQFLRTAGGVLPGSVFPLMVGTPWRVLCCCGLVGEHPCPSNVRASIINHQSSSFIAARAISLTKY